MEQSLADPAPSNAIVDAVLWLQGTVLGSVAQMIAVIAVASIGFLMLSGRVNIRHGATVVLGCFVIFGASTIAQGLSAMAAGQENAGPTFTEAKMETPPPSPQRNNAYDPYAGASYIP